MFGQEWLECGAKEGHRARIILAGSFVLLCNCSCFISVISLVDIRFGNTVLIVGKEVIFCNVEVLLAFL